MNRFHTETVQRKVALVRYLSPSFAAQSFRPGLLLSYVGLSRPLSRGDALRWLQHILLSVSSANRPGKKSQESSKYFHRRHKFGKSECGLSHDVVDLAHRAVVCRVCVLRLILPQCLSDRCCCNDELIRPRHAGAIDAVQL